MFEVKIKNIESQLYTHGAFFPTMEEAQAWITLVSNKSPCPWGTNFGVEVTDKTAEKYQEQSNADAIAYLAATDWYIIRELDSGEACPVEIREARAAARANIVR